MASVNPRLMLSYAVPIALPLSPNADENLNQLAQVVAFRLRQILLFVLGEQSNQIERHFLVVKVVDHSDATARASTTTAPAQLANASRTFHHIACSGMFCEVIHHATTLSFGQKPFRAANVLGQFSDCDHGIRL